jgi:hypothetical protein
MDQEKVRILQTAVFKNGPVATGFGTKDDKLVPAVQDLLKIWLKEHKLSGTLTIKGLRVCGNQIIVGTRIRRRPRVCFVSIEVALPDATFMISQAPHPKRDVAVYTLSYTGDEAYRDIASQFQDYVTEIIEATRGR